LGQGLGLSSTWKGKTASGEPQGKKKKRGKIQLGDVAFIFLLGKAKNPTLPVKKKQGMGAGPGACLGIFDQGP